MLRLRKIDAEKVLRSFKCFDRIESDKRLGAPLTLAFITLIWVSSMEIANKMRLFDL
jgi:hypothetical protein